MQSEIIRTHRLKIIEQALLKFRSWETIEDSINGHKSYTVGDLSKYGDDDSLDGELFIEFLEKSMIENFKNRIVFTLESFEQKHYTVIKDDKNR